MVLPVSGLTSAKRVGAWTLHVPFTIPSCWVTPFGGAVSGVTTGGVGTTGAGGSVVGATGGGSVTGVGVGGVGGAETIADASCFKYCAATNANAPGGASISIQSPFV